MRRVSVNTESRTVFQIDSYVLALNPKGTETRVHCQWLGPFKVIRFNKNEYTIQNLITKKTREVHASQLKLFKFCGRANGERVARGGRLSYR